MASLVSIFFFFLFSNILKITIKDLDSCPELSLPPMTT